VLGDVREARRVIEGGLVVVVHEEPLAEAVPAVGAAHLVDEEQRGVRVLVLAAADGRVIGLEAGVEPAPLFSSDSEGTTRRRSGSAGSSQLIRPE
jgi:hypothetical protein